MLTTLTQLLPVVTGIGVGYLLRRRRVAGQAEGEFVFHIVFYVCLPALMFTSLSRVEITRELGVFALAAPVLVVAGHLAARGVVRSAAFTGTQVPVVLLGSMMVNAAFPLPFVQSLYGAEGVARVAVFDAVNATLTFTWAYYLAARANPAHRGGALLLGRLLRSPALWGIGTGLAVNAGDVTVPPPIWTVAETFGGATAVLLPIGIGILFTPVRTGLRQPASIVATRLATGVAASLAFVAFFDLSGADATVLLLLGVAPVAVSTVTFSSLEDLDVPLATSALSLSLVVGVCLSLGIALVVA